MYVVIVGKLQQMQVRANQMSRVGQDHVHTLYDER